MKIRKILAITLSVCMMGCAFAGCGSDNAAETSKGDAQNAEDKSSASDDAETKGESKGYVFETGGVEIAVDMDMSTLEDKLGEPVSYFEEPSCAAQGIAKLYTYASYEVDTYPDGDKDLVASIILKDDNVATAEGIDLSMTKADVVEKYGEDYEESEGCIVYAKDGMKLKFILDGDNLAAIEYNSSVLD